MINPGNYRAAVAPIQTENGEVWCQFGESGKKQTPMVLVKFEVLRGPYAGERINWYGYFTDNEAATERTIKALRACGFTGDQFAEFVTQRVDQEVEIVIGHETFEGKTRAKVQWVNPVGGGGIKVENQMQAAELRKFSARFQSKLKSTPTIEGPKAVREAPSAAPADDEMPQETGHNASEPEPTGYSSNDDIPF